MPVGIDHQPIQDQDASNGSLDARNGEDHCNPMSKSEVEKLHHYFGHAHPAKIIQLIIKAGRWSEEVD